MKSTIVLLAMMLIGGVAFAQHHGGANASDTLLLRQALNEEGMKNKEVQMYIVSFPPGNVSGAHRHPCQTFGYILEGELISEFEGKTYHYKKGDSFYEFPNGLHSGTKNPSSTVTTKLLVYFINEVGKPTTIREK